jgi:hypothetical protein
MFNLQTQPSPTVFQHPQRPTMLAFFSSVIKLNLANVVILGIVFCYEFISKVS